MELIEIKKELGDLQKKESHLKILYIGNDLNDEIEQEKVGKAVENYIEKHKRDLDMKEAVTFIRTIFRNCEEQQLSIYYINMENPNTQKLETVKYDYGDMSFYEKSKYKADNLEDFLYRILYDKRNLTISYGASTNDKLLDKFDFKQEDVNDDINCILALKNITLGELKLDHDDELLIEIYRLFYNENPNFKDKNINIKFQTMMSIIQEMTPLSIEKYSNFIPLGDLKLPMSLELKDEIDRLYPLGEVSDMSVSVKFSDDTVFYIQTVSECVRRDSLNEQHNIDDLIGISKTLYAKNYQVNEKADNAEIAKVIQCSEKETKRNVKLLEKAYNKKFNKILETTKK